MNTFMEFTDAITGEACFPYYRDIKSITIHNDMYVIHTNNGKTYHLNMDSYTAKLHSSFIQSKTRNVWQ